MEWPTECDLESVMSIHVETQAMVERWIVVSRVEISSMRDCRTDLHLRGNAIATLVVKLGLRSSGRMTEKACDPCGMDGCGMGETNMGSARVARDAGWVLTVDCCSLAPPARQRSPVG